MGVVFFTMMFFDSSFLIGLFIDSDRYHDKAEDLKGILSNEVVVINNVVFNEVMNSLEMTKYGPNYNVNLEELFDFLFNKVVFHHLSRKDYFNAYLMFKHYNQAINYSDFTILETMMKYSINKIVSFDSDFDKIKGLRRIYL